MSAVIRKLRARAPRIVPALLLLSVLMLLMTGCDVDTPQNTFAPEGPVAHDQRQIFLYAMWPAIGVMILVLGGIILICLRFRERDPNSLPPKQLEGNTRLELTWTVLPVVPLLILGVVMVKMIYDLGADPDPNAYNINIEAQRYSWSFIYPDIKDKDGNPLILDGEKQDPHMPTGKQVAFHLKSNDVIHSFWFPRLGGKLDVVPNNDNVLWLQADTPDTFAGECAEYCGLNHATMKMFVHADTPEDFQKWVDEQTAKLNATPAPRPSPSGGAATPSPAPTPTATPAAGG